MDLQTYRPLGASGLLVSPLALGTMTFGTPRWGMNEDGSRAVFDRYVELGGNFIDTADAYSGGRSEEMVGQFVAKGGLREQMVIATKSGFSTGRGSHAGGNGSRHLHASVEASLKRLQTDFIDLYWIHIWDGITPAEEMAETMAGLVRSGKIRYWGLSNTPAWYAAEVATITRLRGLPAPIGLQYFYSLVERGVEAEHLPLGQSAGMGLVPWSPLAYGLLTGKYDRATVEASGSRKGGVPNQGAAGTSARDDGDKRLDGDNPFGDTLFTDRNWHIVDVLKRVADEAGESAARIALAWVVGRAGVASTLMGVSRPEQVGNNVGALDVTLSPEHVSMLDAASSGIEGFLYGLFKPSVRNQIVFGGADVRN
ncbi:aryl-alcohol dehydrogenase-like predicted oxidoreductase [Rhizobium sp. PP-F2F-G48]|uniref:aldo/keto reductase n=1 Tax=Rhizobium sp. PP-F2F-G48 TaxID=2135651 RepID=UPI001045BA90|nr:aldo/keto reductase [Rhizobium sp. PP-F2F-G48]TCM47402.1 aryl-alcohol dehydrogenase-like predicted oxidoreductase [Rhizobium sp. PP-F2F-G48]